MSSSASIEVGPAMKLCLAACLICAAFPARASDPAKSYVDFNFLAYGTRPEVWEAPDVVPFPLEVYGVLTPGGPLSSSVLPLPRNYVMWGFASATGSVRAQANTLGTHLGPPGPPPGNRLAEFRTTVSWEKTFTKGAATDTARFTINRNELSIFSTVPGESGFPFARIMIDVYLLRPSLPSKDPQRAVLQAGATVSLTPDLLGGGDLSACGFPAIVEPFALFFCEFGEDRISGFTNSDSPLHATVEDRSESPTAASLSVSTVPYHGTIDLSQVGDKETYTVKYLLVADAWSTGAENVSFATVGDPLDTSSGMSLDVTSPPASSDQPGDICETQPDTLRYLANRDGTVIDQRTGLMWQRCPVGSHLDDSGTPDDPGDDRCSTASAASSTWQAALQAAAADSTAGHTDWRLPNAKELNSIVETGCVAPAIEGAAFPDTPSTLFWSSTPGRNVGTAMGVNFLAGDLVAMGLSGHGRSRLVRSSTEPVLLPPALQVGNAAPVVEGDSGTVDMVFPIRLDHPAASDVTFHYATADDTARAGEDYDATSGTGTIPAGSVVTEIHVPVRGDLLGEPNEALFLVLDQVSASARLAVAWNRGTIIDDEPVLRPWDTDVYEGDSGSTSLVFSVSLTKAAQTDVTVGYATSDGTARAGQDYSAASGTLTIPAGQRTASIAVPVTGDTLLEADETVLFTLSNPSSNVRLAVPSAVGLIVDDETPTLVALDDTGVDTCADATHQFLACPQTGFPGQDAERGRDPGFPSDADGPNGFVFTKLDSAGVPLPDQSVPFGTGAWTCVRDEVTQLWWEVKSDDGGLRDKDWQYTWFDSTGLDDGGAPGTANGGTCVDTVSCDTEKFVAAVNAFGLCGHSDWRLPGREELASILDGSTGGLSPGYFPNSPPTNGTYWSATAVGRAPGASAAFGLNAWSVSTAGPGFVLRTRRAQPAAVRVVRGGN